MCVTSTICRLCLSNERRTFSVTNTVLQNVWERLTNIKFHKDDGRPLVICYICCAHLRKSHDLMERALKAEEVFTKYITNNHFEGSKDIVSLLVSKAYDIDYKYAIEQQHNIEFKHQGTNTSEEVKDFITIKEEVEDEWTVFKDERIKAEEDIDTEDEENHVKEEEDVFLESNHAENDADDIATETCLEVDDPISTLSHETIFQKEIRIILERIDGDSSARKCKRTEKDVLESLSKSNSTAIDISCSRNLSTNVNVEIPNKKHMTVPGIDYFPVNNISPKNSKLPSDKVYVNSVSLQNKKTLSSKFISCMDAGNESLPNSTSAIAAPITLLAESGEENKPNICNKKRPEKIFPCLICPYKCSSYQNLKRHMQIHTGEKAYICELCDYKSSSNGALKRHLLYIHTKEKNYSCHICQYKCVEKYTLEIHLRNHTGEKPYLCGLCDYKSSSNSALKRHLQYIHTKEKNYSCHICEFKCVKKDMLNRHLRKHTSEKPYVCDMCNFKCAHKYNLKTHLKYKHTKERNFSCHICQYSCVEKGNLKKHLRKHAGEKPYICALCDYKSSNKSCLKRHLQYKHTKEKNYSCHICEYKCVAKSNLEVHLRTHTGEKPYICGLCDYKTSNKSDLKKHVQFKHTKEKNFSCHICQYKCFDKGTLNRHLRKHAGGK